MTNTEHLCAELQTLWHEHFPLSKAMGLEVVSFEDHVLTTRAPLSLNTNIHNTAFAGSLYAIEAMTAWGVLYLEIVSAKGLKKLYLPATIMQRMKPCFSN